MIFLRRGRWRVLGVGRPTVLIKRYKCTKRYFVHLLTATFKDFCISKTAEITKGDIVRITLTACQCADENFCCFRYASS